MHRPPWRVIEEGLFLVLYFLFAWLIVDPRLVHHGVGVLVAYYPFSFHLGWPFLAEHLSRPGGALEYAVRFLSQYFCIGWVGALVITALAWLGWRASDAVARWAGWPHAGIVRYVPPLMLAVLYGGYSQPLEMVASLWLAVGGFLVYARWAPSRPAARVVTIVAGCCVLNWLASLASLEWVVLVAVYEVGVGRRPRLALVALATDVVAGSFLGLVAGQSLESVWKAVVARDPGVLIVHGPLAVALCAFFPLLLVGAVLCRSWWVRRAGASPGGPAEAQQSKPAASGSRHTGKAAKLRRGPRERIRRLGANLARPENRRAIAVLVVLAASAAIVWRVQHDTLGIVLAINYYSQNEEWEKSLEAARRLPPGGYNARCNRNVLLALYHTGRLGDEMFSYPQQLAPDPAQSGIDVFSSPGGYTDMGEFFQVSRLFLELGYVNQAEKCALETLETCGDLPALLEELAVIYVVKDRPETARIFLNALAQHPLYRAKARERLALLARDPKWESDPRAAQIRRNKPRRDRAGCRFRLGDLFLDLNEANPKNRMAFEFHMARCLATGQYDLVAANVSRLKEFGFRHVPRHYQEATAISERKHPGQEVAGGYRPNREIQERLVYFDRLVNSQRNAGEAARAAVNAGLGNTYFFYLTFGTSGL